MNRFFLGCITALLLFTPAMALTGDGYGGKPAMVEEKASNATAKKAPTATSGYEETEWDSLVPASWNPGEVFDSLDLDALEDEDPRAQLALEAFMKEWNKAPINPEMDGKVIKIAGYVAPLDFEHFMELKEFLLVPFFGACIHVPPPPANQIIYISLDKPDKKIQSMDAVWVYGTLIVDVKETDMGNAGYTMKVDKIEPLEEDIDM